MIHARSLLEGRPEEYAGYGAVLHLRYGASMLSHMVCQGLNQGDPNYVLLTWM